MTKNKLFIAECTCPLCGSNEVTYGNSDLNDNIMHYECECDKCGATWNEDFVLSFAGVSDVYDKKGKRMADVLDVQEK